MLVTARLDPELEKHAGTGLDGLNNAAAVAGLKKTRERVAEEDDDLVLRRLYCDSDGRESAGWTHAAERLAELAREHTPAETLDYWMVEETGLFGAQVHWAEHRKGGHQQTVSKHVRTVRDQEGQK